MRRKFFDADLHNKFDVPAKKAAKELFKDLENHNLYLKENEKKIGVDFLVYKNEEHLFNLEVECKTLWENAFPYDTVQFPERKAKFCKLDKPTIFVMFNKTYTQFLTVPDDILINSPKAMVRNRYVRYGEHFFQVPITEVIFNDIRKSIKDIRSKND